MLPNRTRVKVRRLGAGTPGEYRAFIVGTYGLQDDCYILDMVDRLPNQTYDCLVMPVGCVDEENWEYDDNLPFIRNDNYQFDVDDFIFRD